MIERNEPLASVTVNGEQRMVDASIAALVQALNDGGFRTVASCSGHGQRPGNIILSDGRELIIARDWNESREIESVHAGINGEPPRGVEATLRTRAEEAELNAAAAEEMARQAVQQGVSYMARAEAAEARVMDLDAEVAHLRRVEAGAVRQADELAAMRGVVEAARVFKAKHPVARLGVSEARANLDAAINRLDALTKAEG